MDDKERGSKSGATESLPVDMTEAGLTDLASDIGEIGMDRLLGDLQATVVKEVPVIKTIYNLVKAGYAVHDHFFMKKLLRFLNGVKRYDDILHDKIAAALPDAKSRGEMAEHLLYALQRFDQLTKAEALCRLFLARI